MNGGILGKKLGMTRIIKDDGRVIPITVVQCSPNVITQVKTEEKDGYPAIVLGFAAYAKPGKCKKFQHVKEVRIESQGEYEKGGTVTVEIFEEGEKVNIVGTTKGKGFQGHIKRHNFGRGPETHGSHHHREPGSVGSCAKPGRVHRGKKMAGRMGNDRMSLRDVEIIYKDLEKNLLGVKGPVPGAINSLVLINKK